MSDTPRTDAAIWQIEGGEMVCPKFSRYLERELNAANERIKRLEEAGDVCLDMSFRGMHVMAERNWRKAKEAKP